MRLMCMTCIISNLKRFASWPEFQRHLNVFSAETPFNEEVEHLRRLVNLHGLWLQDFNRVHVSDPDTIKAFCDNVENQG